MERKYVIDWFSDWLVFLPFSYLIIGSKILFKDIPQEANANGSLKRCVGRLVLIQRFGLRGWFMKYPALDRDVEYNLIMCLVYKGILPAINMEEK